MLSIAGIAANQAGSQVAWRFVQMHWNKLVDQFGQGNLLKGITKYLFR